MTTHSSPASRPTSQKTPTTSAKQHDVPERVGEVGGDRQRFALGVVERDLEQERRSHRPDREGDADAVEPDAAVEA